MAQARSGLAIQLKLQLTHFLRTKKTRPGTLDRTRLQVAQPALTHRQILHEISECIGDIGRANSSISTTLDLTSVFWQMKLDPESQPIPLDHFTHGITRMSGKLPKADGTSSTRIATHAHLH